MTPTLLLTLFACTIDNGVTGKDGDPTPFDTGSSWTPEDTGETAATPEDCNGVDDDGDGEVDEGYGDLDGDGIADCVDDACEVNVTPAGTVPANDACGHGSSWTPPTDLGDVVLEWNTTGPDILSSPVIGQLTDDDGDGDIDVDDVPDILGINYSTGDLNSFAGDTGALQWVKSWALSPMAIALADVDGDGVTNIVTIGSRGLCAEEPDGTNLWCNRDAQTTYNGGPTITDLDGDGRAEIIAAPAIVDGVTGATLATGVCTNGSTFPAVGDLDGDGQKEIVCGEAVYAADGSLVWGGARASYNYAALVDVDADDQPEILVTGWTYGIYLYDADGTLLAKTGVGGQYSAACVADLDGDGEPEFVVPSSTALEAYEADLTPKWTAYAHDQSGAASCAAFDLDADGDYEVLYADEDRFVILDGVTGGELYVWADHASGTMWEYPTVADVDNDGSAEIVVAESYYGNTGIAVFGHATDGWAPAGPTWSQYAYDGGNVSDEGEVLPDPPPPWRDGGFIHARPPGYLDPASNTWSLGRAVPDLGVAFTDTCVADCTDGPAEVSLTVTNAGAVATDALVILYAVEASGDREIGRATVTVDATTRAEPLVFTLPLTDLTPYGWRATVQRADGGSDCDDTDNEDTWADATCL